MPTFLKTFYIMGSGGENNSFQLFWLLNFLQSILQKFYSKGFNQLKPYKIAAAYL